MRAPPPIMQVTRSPRWDRGSAAASASPNVIDPLAGLGSPARGPSLGLDDLDPLDSGEIDRGLAKLDPLAVRPRISSRVLCAVFGLLLIAAGFGIWWVCVFTETASRMTNWCGRTSWPACPARSAA